MSWWNSVVSGTTIGDEPADVMTSSIFNICTKYEKSKSVKMSFQHFINHFAKSLKIGILNTLDSPKTEFNYIIFYGKKKLILKSDAEFEIFEQIIVDELIDCFSKINKLYLENFERKPTFLEMLEILKFVLPVLLEYFAELSKGQHFSKISYE